MTEILSGVSGPDELRRLNRNFPARYPFLLQSTAQGDKLGRFDILFGFPGEQLVLEGDGQLSGRVPNGQRTFLGALDDWWRAESDGTQPARLPFSGGWFLYLGYELAAEIEPSLRAHSDPVLPRAFAVRCPTALIFDHQQQSCHLLSEGSVAEHRQQVIQDLDETRSLQPDDLTKTLRVEDDEPARFLGAVTIAKKHIEAGDIYQANLSRQWRATVSTETTAAQIYDSLCRTNPAPFAGIACWQDTTIISSSPERLLKTRDGIAATRPIAGTRPRGDNEHLDDSLSSELMAHPKERAEHVMLIDLERNDLGRICIPGSVTVDEMMVVESYAHVHHIVSNVSGRLRDDVTPGEAIAAVFPGGTITGCPKVRCMQIIEELEVSPRGAYTGSFGYLNRDGSLDLNILIRTMIKRGDEVTFRAGAGIVADSDPEHELQESRDKAEGMLRALDHG